jgi:23S rRNA (adenine2503-C2)-methyltransferase
MNDIFHYTLEVLEQRFVAKGFKKYNAKQVYDWIYVKKVRSFDEMTNLSKNLRAYLNEYYVFGELIVNTRQLSSDGTEKFLFELRDGNLIETVLMRHNYGNSVCVTTQLGCNIGCSFCASGLLKKKRDLEIEEIVLQIVEIEQLTKERVSHIVVMGIGEPFDNYYNTTKFFDIINHKDGLNIGARHITVSTSGIVPKIREFAHYNKQINLAISLHASNDKIRTRIMKVNIAYPIKEVIEAAMYYVKTTNRRITFEYILLENVNDGVEHANELSDLIRGINCHVNLIRYNTVEEFYYKGSNENRAQAFHNQLTKRGINATLRREQGSDIDAACGQLRSKKSKQKKA